MNGFYWLGLILLGLKALEAVLDLAGAWAWGQLTAPRRGAGQ